MESGRVVDTLETFSGDSENNKLHRLTEPDSRLIAHYFALLGGLGLPLGYLATSRAKFDVIFLLGDPDFL